MNSNLCVNKKDKRLYNVLYSAIDTTKHRVGINTIVYHWAENNTIIFVKEEEEFNEEFIKLRR